VRVEEGVGEASDAPFWLLKLMISTNALNLRIIRREVYRDTWLTTLLFLPLGCDDLNCGNIICEMQSTSAAQFPCAAPLYA